jgi:hypothetical protein
MPVVETGSGFWSPWVWVVSFLALLLIAWLFYRSGEASYKKGTAQTDPFLSGTPPKPGERVTASHIYWGFIEALKGYYRPLVRAHSGIVNDYLGWLILVMALVFILFTLAR